MKPMKPMELMKAMKMKATNEFAACYPKHVETCCQRRPNLLQQVSGIRRRIHSMRSFDEPRWV